MDNFVVDFTADDSCDWQVGFDQKDGYRYCGRQAKYINQNKKAKPGHKARCINHRP